MPYSPFHVLFFSPMLAENVPLRLWLATEKDLGENSGWWWVTALEGISSFALSCFVSFVGNTYLLYTLPSSVLCILTFRNFFILELWSYSLSDFIQSLNLPEVQRRVMYSEFSVWPHFPQSFNGHSEQRWLKELVLLWSPCCFLGESQWGILICYPQCQGCQENGWAPVRKELSILLQPVKEERWFISLGVLRTPFENIK